MNEALFMRMKSVLRSAAFVTLVTLAAGWGIACAQEMPLVTGEHWVKASEEKKKAYLVGIANVGIVEAALSAANPVSDAQRILPRMVEGREGPDAGQRSPQRLAPNTGTSNNRNERKRLFMRPYLVARW